MNSEIKVNCVENLSRGLICLNSYWRLEGVAGAWKWEWFMCEIAGVWKVMGRSGGPQTSSTHHGVKYDFRFEILLEIDMFCNSP